MDPLTSTFGAIIIVPVTINITVAAVSCAIVGGLAYVALKSCAEDLGKNVAQVLSDEVVRPVVKKAVEFARRVFVKAVSFFKRLFGRDRGRDSSEAPAAVPVAA